MASQFEGGGFMTTQSTPAYESNSSSSSKKRDNLGLLPLTVKQLTVAESGDGNSYKVDGVDVSNVTLVGIVLNKIDRNTDVTFSLDDGTGRIETRKWVNDVVEAKETEQVQEGMYVRVHGHLKDFQGKRTLVAFSIRPVTNFNEIAYHFIECIYVHVYNTKLKVQGGQQAQTHATNSGLGMNSSMGHQASLPNQVPQQCNISGFSNIDKKVLDYLVAHMNIETGVSVNKIATELKISAAQANASISVLVGEGTVYSTIDDYHFKCAFNG